MTQLALMTNQKMSLRKIARAKTRTMIKIVRRRKVIRKQLNLRIHQRLMISRPILRRTPHLRLMIRKKIKALRIRMKRRKKRVVIRKIRRRMMRKMIKVRKSHQRISNPKTLSPKALQIILRSPIHPNKMIKTTRILNPKIKKQQKRMIKKTIRNLKKIKRKSQRNHHQKIKHQMIKIRKKLMTSQIRKMKVKIKIALRTNPTILPITNHKIQIITLLKARKGIRNKIRKIPQKMQTKRMPLQRVMIHHQAVPMPQCLSRSNQLNKRSLLHLPKKSLKKPNTVLPNLTRFMITMETIHTMVNHMNPDL